MDRVTIQLHDRNVTIDLPVDSASDETNTHCKSGLQWVWIPPEDCCTNCLEFNGQIMTVSEWREEYRRIAKLP